MGDGVRARRLARATPRPRLRAARRGASVHRGEPRRAGGITASSPIRRRRARASNTVPDLAEALAGVDWVQENLPGDARTSSAKSSRALDRHAPRRGRARELDVGDPGVAVHRSARRARALPRRASGQSAASRAGRRAVRRAVDRAGDDRARAARVRRSRAGADRRAPRDRRLHPQSAAGRAAGRSDAPRRRGLRVAARISTRRCATASGLRWSFMGPLATIELNAPGGVADYCARYGGFYRRLAAAPPPRRRVGCATMPRRSRRRSARRRARRGATRARAGATAG